MFRDGMANLESLLATLRRLHSTARVIFFCEKERCVYLGQALTRCSVLGVVEYPVDPAALAAAVREGAEI